MEKELPGVSILIVTWNEMKNIDALLKSLEEQSYPKEKIEIILADNASTDGTLSHVKTHYPEVKSIAFEKNLGFAAGHNRAAKYARHELLVILDADTVCHRDWLRGLVLGFLRDEKIGICVSNEIVPGVKEFPSQERYSSLNLLYYFDISPFGYVKYCKSKKDMVFPKLASGSSFIIERKTINQLGYLFDESFWAYNEDVDLSLRVHNLGLKICSVKDSVYYHLYKKNIRPTHHFLRFAAMVTMNRVYAYFKNMGNLEFLLYFPILFLGGIFKIFELPIKERAKKFIYFLPFSLFSMFCMILALFQLPKYKEKRRFILENRAVSGKLPILKLVLFNKHG